MAASLDTLGNIAVLIDADNASAKNISRVLQEIEKLGHISCKKIYGDWGNAHIQSWQEALLKHAIDPMQHFAYVKGKNATDIGMVIEAMDLLYSKKYDGFCLISSDSDFTSLALRIRKNGVKVFGFGKRNTVDAFTHACDQFFYVEDLLGVQNKANHLANSKTAEPSIPWTTKQLQTQEQLINVLNKLIKANPNNNKGWSDISYLAREIKQNYSNINLEKYNYKKFSDLIIALKLFDIKRQNNGVWARVKVLKTKSIKDVDHNVLSKTSNSTPRLSNTPDSKPIILPDAPVTIKIVTAPMIDSALFRVDEQTVVRGDQDMIFYGQTHSMDGSIVLEQTLNEDNMVFEFDCDLSVQPKSIEQLMITVSTELNALNMSSLNQIELKITDNTPQAKVLFSGYFDTLSKESKSLLIATIRRSDECWQCKPMHRKINGDLRFLCEKYGVELSDA